MSSNETIASGSQTMGSVHYFSPEQAKGGYTDEKSDIYSLGVVMYEMVTGEVPFEADTPVSVALKQIQEEPIEPKEKVPTVTNALNKIILKAMAKQTAALAKPYIAQTVIKGLNPVEAIKEGEIYVIDPEQCIDCGACQGVCPTESIVDE